MTDSGGGIPALLGITATSIVEAAMRRVPSILLLCCFFGCSGGQVEQPPAPLPAPAPPVVPEEKSPIELIGEKTSLAEAVTFARPLMTDVFNDPSPGTLLL